MVKFFKEFKKELKMAIIAAVGFIIAFAWKDAIFRISQNFIHKITNTTNIFLNDFWNAVLLTFIGVIIIAILSKLSRN